MNDRDKLITALEDAITELKVRRDDPTTPSGERTKIDARLAELEAQLAQLRAQDLAAAAAVSSLVEADSETGLRMRELARQLDDAVAEAKETKTLLNLVKKGLTALAGVEA